MSKNLVSFSNNRSDGSILDCNIADFISSLNGTMICSIQNDDIWDASFYLTTVCNRNGIIFNENDEMKYWVKSQNNIWVTVPVFQKNRTHNVTNLCQSKFFLFLAFWCVWTNLRTWLSILSLFFLESLFVRFNENSEVFVFIDISNLCNANSRMRRLCIVSLLFAFVFIFLFCVCVCLETNRQRDKSDCVRYIFVLKYSTDALCMYENECWTDIAIAGGSVFLSLCLLVMLMFWICKQIRKCNSSNSNESQSDSCSVSSVELSGLW